MNWKWRISLVALLFLSACGGGGESGGPLRLTATPATLPASGPKAGGTFIRVEVPGATFQTGSRVWVGGFEATSPTVVSTNAITARTPVCSSGGDASVLVRNPNGQVFQSPNSFHYIPEPVITAVAPPFGQPGSPVILQGYDFAPGARVHFAGVSVPVSQTAVLNGGLMVAEIPPGAGVVDVRVTNADGTTAVMSGGFEYFAPPAQAISIASATPPGGSIYGKTPVTIRGANFPAQLIFSAGGPLDPAVTPVDPLLRTPARVGSDR